MTPRSPADDSLLLIRCPACSQRFKVDQDFRGKTVECGGCDHRFQINDEVLVRAKKMYPGERSEPGLNRFPRIPLPAVGSAEVATALRQSNLPDPAVIEPVSPQRIIAGIVGVAVMIVVGLILLTGATRNGPLEGVVFGSRLLIAGFASLLGFVMLVYASPKARGRAMTCGVLLAAGLMALPFFFQAPARLEVQGAGAKSKTVTAVVESTEDIALAAKKARIGTGPLDAEMEKLRKAGSNKRAIGLWVRGLNGGNRYLLENYIMRTTGADFSSHFYPRENGEYLFVVTGITQTLQELAAIAAVVGNSEKIYPELSVIELVVENGVFVESPGEKLVNKDDPEFYMLNKRELNSIDYGRIERAVQRLAGVSPKLYRADITQKLISLLDEDGVDFKSSICTALAVWSETTGPAGDAAFAVVEKLHAAQKPISQDLVSLVVKDKNLRIIPILNQLWLKDPRAWESLFADLGPAIEPSVCEKFAKLEGLTRYSAVRLLERVGGRAGLEHLEALNAGGDSELRVMLDNARKAVRARLGGER
jgi:predicted Zn finger-like uncharacterized protein